MFDWIGKLFNVSDPELDELDRKIVATDARIAEKQAYLEQLTANVEANREAVKDLEDTVGRLRKAVKSMEN